MYRTIQQSLLARIQAILLARYDVTLTNLIVAAGHAFSDWRRRQKAYAELMALDDRSLADIGLHRTQIPALVEGAHRSTRAAEPDAVVASAFADPARFVGGRPWMPPV